MSELLGTVPATETRAATSPEKATSSGLYSPRSSMVAELNKLWDEIEIETPESRVPVSGRTSGLPKSSDGGGEFAEVGSHIDEEILGDFPDEPVLGRCRVHAATLSSARHRSSRIPLELLRSLL